MPARLLFATIPRVLACNAGAAVPVREQGDSRLDAVTKAILALEDSPRPGRARRQATYRAARRLKRGFR